MSAKDIFVTGGAVSSLFLRWRGSQRISRPRQGNGWCIATASELVLNTVGHAVQVAPLPNRFHAGGMDSSVTADDRTSK